MCASGGIKTDMQPFRSHTGVTVALDRANIDTDQIIPKQFLKRIERSGFGEFLFHDWRRQPDGSPVPDFPLDEPCHQGASILITGRNFGCGSSREHAAWALMDHGFRAIIAPSFADIFTTNSQKNGLVLAQLPEDQVKALVSRSNEIKGYKVTVDLETCRVSDGREFSAPFPIDTFVRQCLLEGLDDIGLTLQHESAITAYERTADARSYAVHTR